MTYDELLISAENEGLIVKEKPIKGTDGRIFGNRVAIRQNIPTTQKACALAEELGHHHTSAGNIINLEDTRNAKQEHVARVWSYNKMIGLSGIIQAYKRHCFNSCEMAEYLDVTEEFLQEALEYYRQKYAPCIKMDGYYIIFEPSLAVVETSFLYDFKIRNMREGVL